MRGKSESFTLILGLGSAQLIAWGTLYYAIAVLGQPMRSELGLTDPALFGLFTWSLALSGLLAPWAGRLVDRMGGRFVLALSSVIGACGFVVLATAHSLFALGVGWTLNGLAMTLGLYDMCFAALAQIAPLQYRTRVTGVTLIGGFASTVAWPASHYLLRETDWRGTCFAYSAALLACVPLYLFALPSLGTRVRHDSLPEPVRTEPPKHMRATARFLALAFAGTAFISGAFSAHLIQTLSELQISHEHAVWLASTIGALQVAGRVIESRIGQRHTAMRLGLVTFGLLALSTLLLLGTGVLPWLVIPFVVFYGTANGLTTVAKAAIPVELLGFAGVGATLGQFSAPSLLARAAAPYGFALLTSRTGVSGTLALMALLGMSSLAAFMRASVRASSATHND